VRTDCENKKNNSFVVISRNEMLFGVGKNPCVKFLALTKKMAKKL